MSDIRRFDIIPHVIGSGWYEGDDAGNGQYVTYADHAAVVARLEAELSALKAQLSAHDEQPQEPSPSIGKCPVCGSPIYTRDGFCGACHPEGTRTWSPSRE